MDGTPIDLLIRNAVVVTLNPQMDLLHGAEIAISGGTILDIGALTKRYLPRQTLDAAGMVCMPGLINAHTHAAMTLFRGYADDLPLQQWLGDNIFPLEARHVNAEFVQAGVALAAAEMILSGTTTFCDMYYFTREAAEVVAAIGIRGVLGEALLDYPTPNMKNPADGLRYAEDMILQYRNHDYVIPCVDPHAIYTCSPDLLEKACTLSRRYDVPLHIHISETDHEVTDSLRRHGQRPIEFLGSLGFLGNNLTVAHCIHPSAGEMDLLAEHDVKVAHCIESNMKLATGLAPVHQMLPRGITVCLGTDGPASNNNLNMFEEMSICAKYQKVATGDPTVLDARTALVMATRNGARAIGREHDLGSIEVGKKADIIMLDMNKPHLTPLHNVCSHLAYSAQAADVDTVLINGKIVMEGRVLTTIDIDKTLHDARQFGERLRHAG